jgi:2,3-dihydroxybenzoate-AMP ligase/mycobactin salicyl-AMP ligase
LAAFLKGCTPYQRGDADRYNRLRWWSGRVLSDLLDKAADVFPHKEAFADGVSRLSFSQAREKANSLAISFMDLGIQPQDRVLIQLPNWNEFVYTYFALQKIGAIVVLLIDRYRQYEVSHLVRLTGASVWVVPETYKKTHYLPIIKDVRKENAQIRHVILARGGEHEGCLSLNNLIENGEATEENLRRLAERRPDPMQVAHMGPTGGTTGLPKVVPRTHNSLICGNEYVALAWDLVPDDICLLAGPIGHDLTFTKGLIAGLITFSKFVFLDSVDMTDVCRTIEEEKITAIVWVPTLASRLVHYDNIHDYNLSSLKKMHCGGGVSPPDLIKAVRRKLGCTYYNAYGGTEGQSTLTRSHDDLEKIYHTVGRPTCPYDMYKVTDRHGTEQPPRTTGELLIKGPGIFTGYYNNPDENARAFTKDGFFRTGDLAHIDELGYVVLDGRVKEMINRAGESISATEIEKLIMGHPDVDAAAVIPMPDPQMGERVCAYIQPRQGAVLDFKGIIAFLQGKKASVLQLPERIEFIDSMPLTKAEKVNKKALKADIEQKIRDS